MIWLFTSAITSAFVECQHGLERLIISNNHIKSDVYIKLKHSRISLDIYQHISYRVQNQKKEEENNIPTMKTYQMPNK